MNIAILLYDGVTALDAIGPYEVLSLLPDAKIQFVAKEIGAKRTDTGFLALTADYQLDAVSAPLRGGDWRCSKRSSLQLNSSSVNHQRRKRPHCTAIRLRFQ